MFFYHGILKKILEEKKQNIDDIKVYHVANPNVGGRIIDRLPLEGEQTIEVLFDIPVRFDESQSRQRGWICNPKLLYLSPEEAWKNKRY